jgi:predicted metal-binding protein
VAKKIAVIVREATLQNCTGKGCFKAFFSRKDSFENYDADAEIRVFTHEGGDIQKKLERMIEEEIDVVHLSTCLRGKSDQYEILAKELSEYFQVIGYTHGSREGQKGNTVFYPSPKM